MPIVKELAQLALSPDSLIRRSLGSVELSEPVEPLFTHGGDADLVAFSPCPFCQSRPADVSQSSIASVPGVSRLLCADQLPSDDSLQPIRPNHDITPHFPPIPKPP